MRVQGITKEELLETCSKIGLVEVQYQQTWNGGDPGREKCSYIHLGQLEPNTEIPDKDWYVHLSRYYCR